MYGISYFEAHDFRVGARMLGMIFFVEHLVRACCEWLCCCKCASAQ